MRLLLILGCALASIIAEAQQKDLFLSSDKRKSIQYKVGSKETLFSLSRKFFVHPRYLASFNKLPYDKGLQLGQSLLIPLSDTNFSVNASQGIPVYRVNKNQKKQLVGRVLKNEELQPAEISQVISTTNSTPISSNDLAAPVTEIKADQSANASPVVQESSSPIQRNVDTIVTTEEAGYFKYAYEEQLLATGSVKQAVKAGIFKTTSGWKDRKYYLLTNAAAPGTYVQLYAPGTQKTVYAKVLGEMSGIRQNEGYDIRISNAAAAVLGVGESLLFELEISYIAPVKR